MRLIELLDQNNILSEEGKIIPRINTTKDVQPGETQRQAKKFGNILDKEGRPPLLGKFINQMKIDPTATMHRGGDLYGKDGTRLKK